MSDIPPSQQVPARASLPEQVISLVSIYSAFVIVWCFLFSLGYIGQYREFPLEFYFFINHASLTSAAFPVILSALATFLCATLNQSPKVKSTPLNDIVFIAGFSVIINWFFLAKQIDNALFLVKSIAGEVSSEHQANFVILPIIAFTLLLLCFALECRNKKGDDDKFDWKSLRIIIIIFSIFFAPFFEGSLYSLTKKHSTFLSCIITKNNKTIQGIVMYTNTFGVMLQNPATKAITFHYADGVSYIDYNCKSRHSPT